MSDAHLKQWKTLAPLGLVATGLGASLIGHATTLKAQGAPTLRWVVAGTVSLAVFNAGLCLFGEAVKHRALHDWQQEARTREHPPPRR